MIEKKGAVVDLRGRKGIYEARGEVQGRFTLPSEGIRGGFNPLPPVLDRVKCENPQL